MKDKKLTQRMWDVLTQWIGDTIVVDEYTISIRRGSRNSTVIWVSIDYRGRYHSQIGLESKDIGTFRLNNQIAEILRKAFELKVNGGSYLNSNPCAEIPLMSTTTEAETNCNSINGYHYDEHFAPLQYRYGEAERLAATEAETNCNSINGYHYDEHFIPPDDAIVPSGPW